MKCPYCSKIENKVIDSRLGKNAESIRRRRECLECGARFTTREAVEQPPITIIKKDGRREPFNRDKIIAGIKMSCQKRPVSVTKIEDFESELETSMQWFSINSDISSTGIEDRVEKTDDEKIEARGMGRMTQYRKVE